MARVARQAPVVCRQAPAHDLLREVRDLGPALDGLITVDESTLSNAIKQED
jgi:hypothetical protein